MRGRRLAVFALAVTAAVAIVWGVGRRGADEAAAEPAPPRVRVQVQVPTPVTATGHAPSAPACVPGATRPVPGGSALAVRVIRPTSALHVPGGRTLARFGLHNVNGVRTVLGVRATRVGADCRPTWYRVQLPIRPNGITGWVRARDVRVFTLGAHVTVDLSDRRVVVARGGRVVLDVKAAIGNPATPTPTGRYFVNQRLWAADPSGPWGPGGVGISAFSPVLVDWVQGGPIAIHGTNQPYLLGDAISHGCVRVSNFALLRLMKLAPEGTPVDIRA